ncbi:hypothetical protein K1719_035816 [Acacia pycnantha]|nr:hypothetical protein K1719_035816 [Acacia pycnantha]
MSAFLLLAFCMAAPWLPEILPALPFPPPSLSLAISIFVYASHNNSLLKHKLSACCSTSLHNRQSPTSLRFSTAAHVSYVQSLKNTGTALRKFIETGAPIQSSLYTSTNNATQHPIGLTDKILLQFPASLQSESQRFNKAETFSSSPSPPGYSKIQAEHMKFSSFSSRKVEEKPPVHSVGKVTSSDTPQSSMPGSNERNEMSPLDDSTYPVRNQPSWDYFGLSDNQFSNLDGAEEKDSSQGKEDSLRSEDEFDNDPAPSSLVQRFENLNRVNYNVAVNESLAATKLLVGDPDSGVELMNGEKGNSLIHHHWKQHRL